MEKQEKKLINLCPFIFQAILPYWLTFSQDGWFDWVKKGDGVIVQCPNPKGIVAKLYKKKTKGKIRVEMEIIGNKSDCSWGWQIGDKFFLPQKIDKCSILKGKQS